MKPKLAVKCAMQMERDIQTWQQMSSSLSTQSRRAFSSRSRGAPVLGWHSTRLLALADACALACLSSLPLCTSIISCPHKGTHESGLLTSLENVQQTDDVIMDHCQLNLGDNHCSKVNDQLHLKQRQLTSHLGLDFVSNARIERIPDRQQPHTDILLQ